MVETKAIPQHPIQSKFDSSIIEFAQKRTNGHEKALEMVDTIKGKLATYLETENTVSHLLVNWKNNIANQLEHEDTPLMHFFITNLNRLVADIQKDNEAQVKINKWITESISGLLITLHNKIGNRVRSSLIKVDNKELVEQIEGKVENDLQYVR